MWWHKLILVAFLLCGVTNGQWRQKTISVEAGGQGDSLIDDSDENDDDSDENTGEQFDEDTETCPCVKKPKGSSECVPYQASYQAATIEEAIANFKDTTAIDPQTATLLSVEMSTEIQGKSSGKNRFDCMSSKVCKGCMELLVEKMEHDMDDPIQHSWNDPSTNSTKRWLSRLKNKLGVNRRYLKRYCSSLQRKLYPQTSPANDFVVDDQDHIDVSNVDMAMIMASIKDSHRRRPRPIGQGDRGEWRSRATQFSRNSRTKRQSGVSLGTSSEIECPYVRGTRVDGSNYCGLCNLCWSWRTLPSNYFPRLINELQCSSTNKCLGGWGSCFARYKSIDVLLNTGTNSLPNWQPVSLNTPIACECRIEFGSALHNFVKA